MQNDTPISGNPAHLELVCRVRARSEVSILYVIDKFMVQTAALCNNSGIKENSEDASGWVPLGT